MNNLLLIMFLTFIFILFSLLLLAIGLFLTGKCKIKGSCGKMDGEKCPLCDDEEDKK